MCDPWSSTLPMGDQLMDDLWTLTHGRLTGKHAKSMGDHASHMGQHYKLMTDPRTTDTQALYNHTYSPRLLPGRGGARA